MSSKGWQFEEINIRETPGAIDELRRRGALATPTLLVGDRMIVGFDREEIDRAVAASQSAPQ
ncbi:MAG: hypothetical protein DMG07_09800 [Acidobacteria bacterium]|nr:MAG: hypothetical protein DMG07_09800 [Acidobacteriota bacterium]